MNTLKNNVQLVGKLTRNPEIKTFDEGKKVANFAIAVSNSFMDEAGRRVESVNYFDCVAWNGLAGFVEKYAFKGDRLAVCGRLVNESGEAENGVKRSKTKIIVSDILLLNNKKSSSQ